MLGAWPVKAGTSASDLEPIAPSSPGTGLSASREDASDRSVHLARMRVAITQMKREILVAEVRELETKSGNTRYVVSDDEGNEYTTFREPIGAAALRAKGSPARIEYHEQQRGQYTNVYLDAIEPINHAEAGEDTDPEEAGWRTAVDAAPWLVGTAEPKEEASPDELFDKLKPFKERVAEDIRDEQDVDEAAD
jgi:hypothetical protein